MAFSTFTGPCPAAIISCWFPSISISPEENSVSMNPSPLVPPPCSSAWQPLVCFLSPWIYSSISLSHSLYLKKIDYYFLLLFLSSDSCKYVCFSWPQVMPAALEKSRGREAENQYVKLRSEELQDRNSLCKTSTGKAGRQSYQVFLKGAINLFVLPAPWQSDEALRPLLRIMIWIK